MRACEAMAVQTRLAGCTELLARKSLSTGDRALAYLKRSNAYYALNDIDHAIADLQAASALTPHDYMPLHELAIGYREKGETERAIETMDRAIAINPQSAESFCHRGEMNRALSRFVEAEADFETVIDLAPDNKIALIENGAITRATSNRLRPTAIRNSRRPTSSRVRRPRAVDTLDRAVDALSNVGTFYALRASYYEHRDVKRASADLDKAIALDPLEVRALAQRGRLHSPTETIRPPPRIGRRLGKDLAGLWSAKSRQPRDRHLAKSVLFQFGTTLAEQRGPSSERLCADAQAFGRAACRLQSWRWRLRLAPMLTAASRASRSRRADPAALVLIQAPRQAPEPCPSSAALLESANVPTRRLFFLRHRR